MGTFLGRNATWCFGAFGAFSAALPGSDGRGFTQEVTFQRKCWIVSVMQSGNRILKA